MWILSAELVTRDRRASGSEFRLSSVGDELDYVRVGVGVEIDCDFIEPEC